MSWTDNICDVTKLKWCPSMHMTFTQQFTCIKEICGQKWICRNVVSMNDHGGVVLQPEKLLLYKQDSVLDRQAKDRIDSENETYKPEDLIMCKTSLVVAHGKMVALHLLNYCDFCGASLKFPKENESIG